MGYVRRKTRLSLKKAKRIVSRKKFRRHAAMYAANAALFAAAAPLAGLAFEAELDSALAARMGSSRLVSRYAPGLMRGLSKTRGYLTGSRTSTGVYRVASKAYRSRRLKDLNLYGSAPWT